MNRRLSNLRLLAVATFLVMEAGFASAQPTLTGVRATIGATEADGTVDLDVTLYTTPGPEGSPYPVGFLGDQYTGTSTFLGYTTSFLWRILDPEIDAIDWGDGSVLDRTTIPLVSDGSPRVFRGSFRHTYADTSVDHTVRVGSFGFLGAPDTAGYDNPRLPPVTGNATYVTAVETYFRYSVVGHPDSTYTRTTVYPFPSPHAVALTNTVVVPSSRFPVALEIPTVSRWGLLLLALAMAAGGLALIRP